MTGLSGVPVGRACREPVTFFKDAAADSRPMISPLETREPVLHRFDREVRQKPPVLAAAYRTEQSGPVIRSIGPHSNPSHNWIDHYCFAPEDAPEFIDAQLCAYRELGHRFRWKVYSHDSPKELPAMLIEHGFTKSHTCSLMVMESAACKDRCPAAKGGLAVTHERIVDPDRLESELRPVWDDWADDLLGAIAEELCEMGDHLAVYVAKVEEQPVSAGLVRYDRDFQFGGLFAGKTIPEMRGKGLYRSLLGARAAHALANGVAYLYIEAGEMSRPIVERIGFRVISQITNYVSPLQSSDS